VPLTLRPHVSTAETESGTVLLDEAHGRYWLLNNTAALILNTLLDGATEQQAAHRLRERHPSLAADRASADVASLVSSLTTARLVSRA
jgi:hypothetical protein